MRLGHAHWELPKALLFEATDGFLGGCFVDHAIGAVHARCNRFNLGLERLINVVQKTKGRLAFRCLHSQRRPNRNRTCRMDCSQAGTDLHDGLTELNCASATHCPMGRHDGVRSTRATGSLHNRCTPHIGMRTTRRTSWISASSASVSVLKRLMATTACATVQCNAHGKQNKQSTPTPTNLHTGLGDVRKVCLQIAQAGLQQLQILLDIFSSQRPAWKHLGTTAMHLRATQPSGHYATVSIGGARHLEGAHSGDDDRTMRRQPRSTAFDIDELFKTNIGTKTCA